jgi:1,4-dihydroxy-6-naphthoate synthase
MQQKVDGLIKRSLEYAFANYPLITDYVKQHSQEMSETVMRQHIDLYVNNYSLQLGAEGKAAVNTFMDIYKQLKKVAAHDKEIFLATAE